MHVEAEMMSAHDWRVAALPIHLAGKFWCVSAVVRGLDTGQHGPEPLEIEGHEVEGMEWDDWLAFAMRWRGETEEEVMEWINARIAYIARRQR